MIQDHLWQSTLFAAAAGLLALALRENHARARYWLWLSASVKFLIPFAVLAAIGSRLEWRTIPATMPPPGVVEQIGQVFTAPALPQAESVPAAPGLVPTVLFAIWACGFLAVLFSWWVRWRRIRAAVRAALPLPLEAEVPVLSSPGLIEPGVFGIFRPALLLPEGITDHLAPAQLKAIVAHELCHVRRRDNLTGAIHMLVEAAFWFHPVVWWLGARLVEERERACDEEVLRLGSDPQVYAESILRVCQFYLGSPLACVSGVTGSDLKKRIVCIMTRRMSRKLNFGKQLLLAGVGTMAVAGPIVFGLLNSPQSRAQSQPVVGPSESFEVASIKPNKSGDRSVRIMIAPGGRLTASNVPLKMLIKIAYGVQDFQISGGPGWISSEKFDVEAKPPVPPGADLQKPIEDPKVQEERRKGMLQALLADRFKLTLHRESKELPVYALVIAKNGPRLQKSTVVPADLEGLEPKERFKRQGLRMGRGELSGQAVPLKFLADSLSNSLGRTVLDQTGLTGFYDFTLKWTPDPSQGAMFKGPEGNPGGGGAPPPDTSGPSIFTAIQEQLGLKLESRKGPGEILVIDRVERPSEN